MRGSTPRFPGPRDPSRRPQVATRRPSLSWAESVDQAFGFDSIDGVRRPIDDNACGVRLTPRKASSIRRAVNLAKVEPLRQPGRMMPADEAAFAGRCAARSVGHAYEHAFTASWSDEELRAFKRQKDAWRFFKAIPASSKRSSCTGSPRPGVRRRVPCGWSNSCKPARLGSGFVGTCIERPKGGAPTAKAARTPARGAPRQRAGKLGACP